MPGRIIIWTNKPEVAERARESMRAEHPGVSCVTMNPRFYPGEIRDGYAASIVCVGPDARQLVSDYEAAGAAVVLLDGPDAPASLTPAPTATPEVAAADTTQPAFRRRRRG